MSEFRRRGITQKKTHNIQNTAKAWNQEYKKKIVLMGIWLGPYKMFVKSQKLQSAGM